MRIRIKIISNKKEGLNINTQTNISTPQNAKIIKILGILSFLAGPLGLVFLIITLVMSKGYNKSNNYGENSDIKIGKTCALISLMLKTLIILCYILLTVDSIIDFFQFF